MPLVSGARRSGQNRITDVGDLERLEYEDPLPIPPTKPPPSVTRKPELWVVVCIGHINIYQRNKKNKGKTKEKIIIIKTEKKNRGMFAMICRCPLFKLRPDPDPVKYIVVYWCLAEEGGGGVVLAAE